MAALSLLWRADHRGRESLDPARQKRDLRGADRLFQAHLSDDAGYRPRPVHGADGDFHDFGGLHLCRGRAGAHERTRDLYLYSLLCGAAVAGHPGDRAGLELLQAPAGDCGKIRGCRCALLYLSPRLFHGRLQGNKLSLQILVPDGRVAAVAAYYERLVPSCLRFVRRAVYRKRRRADERQRQHLPLALLRSRLPQVRTAL